MWGHMYRCFEIGPQAPGAARKCIDEWLSQLGWDPSACADVVLAVSEATTNTVQHAYPRGCPGKIIVDAATLTGRDGAQRLRITVTDHGAWRVPAASVPSSSAPTRGRGLMMIRAVMSQLQVNSDASGTQVTMVTKPTRPALPTG